MIKSKTAQQLRVLKSYVPVRDALREVMAANVAKDEAAAVPARRRLNAAYDAFVERHGPVNSHQTSIRRKNPAEIEAQWRNEREAARSTGREWRDGSFDPTDLYYAKATDREIAAERQKARERYAEKGLRFDDGDFDPLGVAPKETDRYPNIDAFREDPEWTSVAAIEAYDKDSKAATKRDVFFSNVLVGEPEPSIRSAEDAMLWVLNREGRFSLAETAAKWGRTEEETASALGDKLFLDPASNRMVLADEYLAGDIRQKLRRAEKAAREDGRFARNVQALSASLPRWLGRDDITVRFGSPWVSEDFLRLFLSDAVGVTGARATKDSAGEFGRVVWKIGGRTPVAAKAAWGTKRLDPVEIVEALANQKSPVVRDRHEDGGTSVNTVETESGREQGRKLLKEFHDWIWRDPARAAAVERDYNNLLNSSVPRSYDGSHLTTPGVDSAWRWRPYQRAAIARIIASGNTYISHAVGSGKTSTAIGAVMELRRLGLVRKAMVVVPNSLLDQFALEWAQQYPGARVAVADKNRFHTSRRRRWVAEIGQADLDAVVITQPAFEKLPLSAENAREVLRSVTELMRASGTKRVEQRIEALERRFLDGAAKDDHTTFESLGVDMLVVDEAQNYRKLQYGTGARVKGVDPDGSARSLDLLMKARYLEGVNPGRGLVMMSGTPVTNTLAEVYTLQRFFQIDELKAKGIDAFDAWAANFAETSEEFEQGPDGTWQSTTRFSRFVNVPELARLTAQFMDTLTDAQLQAQNLIALPRLEGGKRQRIVAERSAALAAYQEELGARIRAIRARSGPPSRGDDIMLAVISDGRKAATDIRLVDPALYDPAEPTKIDMVVDNVHRVWKASRRQSFHEAEKGGSYSPKTAFSGPATQMVFANFGLDRTAAWNVPDHIIGQLVSRGVPRREIAFIGDAKTAADRQRLFNDLNDGKVRVLIGSTDTIGTGVNAQKRLVAAHNVDPLWFPAADTQRVGRIRRQGNMNPVISVFDYSTRQTYDVAMWGMMARKQRFIEQFFRGDPALRDIEDMGAPAEYEEAMALAASDPRVLEMAQLNKQAEDLQRKKAAVASRNKDYERAAEMLEGRIDSLESAARKLARQARIRTGEYKGADFRMTIGKKVFDSRPKANKELKRLHAAASFKTTARKAIGDYAGFRMELSSIKYNTGEKDAPPNVASIGLHEDGSGDLVGSVDRKAVDFVASLSSILAGLEKTLEKHETEARNARRQLEKMRDGARERFEDEADLEAARSRLAQVRSELAPAKPVEEPGVALSLRRAGGEGMSPDAVREAITPVAGKWADGPAVRVVRRWTDVPESDMPESAAPPDGTDGMYDPSSGTAWLFADNIPTPERARRVLAHEVLGHYGIRRVLGDDMPAFLAEVRSLADRDAGVAAVWRETVRRYGAEAPTEDHVAEEVVARLAERSASAGPVASLLRRLAATVRRFLRSIGLPLRFSQADIMEMVAAAGRVVRGKTAPPPRAPGVEPGYAVPRRNFYARAALLVREQGGPAATGSDWAAFLRRPGPRTRPGELDQAPALSAWLERRANENIPKADLERALLAETAERVGGTETGLASVRVATIGPGGRLEDAWGLHAERRLDTALGETLMVGVGRAENVVAAAAVKVAAERAARDGMDAVAWTGAFPDRATSILEGWPPATPVAGGQGFRLPAAARERLLRPRFSVAEDDGQTAWLRKPLDRVARLPFRVLGGVDANGDYRPGRWLVDSTKRVWKESQPHESKLYVVRSLADVIEAVRRGVVDRYEQPPSYRKLDFKRQREKNVVYGVMETILDSFDRAGLTADDARAMYDVLTGRTDESALDAKLRDLAAPVRTAVDELGAHMVEAGLLSEATWRKNLGTYLHRSYVEHEAVKGVGGWMERRRRGRLRLSGDELRRRGLELRVELSTLLDAAPPAERSRFAADIVGTRWRMSEDGGRRRFDPSASDGDGVWTAAEKRGGKVVMRRDYTADERDAMGEIRDVRYATVRTMSLLGKDLSSGRFFAAIAQNPEWASDEFHAGWVRVSMDPIPKSGQKKWGALAGKFVPNWLWRDLMEVERMRSPKWWEDVIRAYKVSKTGLSPVVHFNNVAGNLVMAEFHDLAFRDLYAAVAAWKSKDAYWREARTNGVFGHSFLEQEITRQTVQPALRRVMEQLGAAPENAGLLRRAAVWRGLVATYRGMTRAYQFEDEIFRLAHYIRLREDGVPELDAAEGSVRAFLDYDIRAPWVNAARRTVLPFAGYMYRAVPMLAEKTVTRPWVFAKIALLAWGLQQAFMELAGDDEERDAGNRRTFRARDKGMTWIAVPGTSVGVPRRVRMWWNDRHGNPVYLDADRLVPGGDVFETGATMPGIPAWLQMGGPLAIMGEILANRVLFTGGEIYDPLIDTPAEKWGKAAKHAYMGFAPSPMGWHAVMMKRAASGERDAFGRVYSVPAAAGYAVGVKLKSHDVAGERRWRLLEIDKRRRALAARMRRDARDHQRGILSRPAYDAARREAASRLAEMASEAQEASR